MKHERTTCPSCGAPLATGTITCPECGMNLHAPVPESGGTEEILADMAANLFRGIEGVGGRLKITSRRLVFQPHAVNFQRSPLELSLGDIGDVRKRNTLGLIPNGMLVSTLAGVEYKFVVWGRDRLIGMIRARAPNLRP